MNTNNYNAGMPMGNYSNTPPMSENNRMGGYADYLPVPARKANFVTNLKVGYHTGYKTGWENYGDYPRGPFSVYRASKGFHDGMRDHRRYDKYQRHFN
jgi:hypothetical protein